MYRFQVSAVTQPGETIAIVGATSAMGRWEVAQSVRLCTSRERYPLWWVDLDLKDATGSQSGDRPVDYKVDYKYVRIDADGQIAWETPGSPNRWVPIEAQPLPSLIIVEDGLFGTIQPAPYGYFANPLPQPVVPPHPEVVKVVVLGSSVALGCSAWLLRGWAWHLGRALQQHYGHQLVNLSEIGTNVSSTIARFSQVVVPEQPDIVIIALSLGNEGLASSSPQQYRAIQRRFENGLQQLVKLVREIGAVPMLGAVYPNGGYSSEHYRLLQETHQRLLTWGIPLLDWLGAVDDGTGRWQSGLGFDPAHPNTDGHYQMYEAIDLTLFEFTKADRITPQPSHGCQEQLLYQDPGGFLVFVRQPENRLRIMNTSPYPYTLTPDWTALQRAIRVAQLPTDLYMAETPGTGTVSTLFVQDDNTIATPLTIAPAANLVFHPVFHFFAQQGTQLLFNEGHLSLLKGSDRHLYVINQSDHEYKIHPMWKEVRAALKAMPAGVYEDLLYTDIPFRTMMIAQDGLESRIKIPARSAMRLDYRCSLSAISRVAILPLGDRCAVRMLLYKLEYDGPAFPFDLTRTTGIADVADIIQSDFYDMWNPNFLHYHHDARRIYHTKWTGLSFAHEVEDTDDPVNGMLPVYERMRARYTARANRFWYTLRQCDQVLFVRTGICDRGGVMDLIYKLQTKCHGKPFLLLLISPQASDEFAHIPNLRHHNVEFNPDRMYEDLAHWNHCTQVMKGILDSLSISSKNLFWCPPTLPKP